MKNRHIILICALLTGLVLSDRACASGPRCAMGEQYRIGTYNLWRSDLGKDEYSWSLRKDRLVQSIKDNEMDIFAAEEIDTTLFREIPELLEQYEWLVFSPYAPDGSGSIKAQAIVYRKDKFEPLDFHHFWLSPSPDEISGGWDEMKFKRGACCATFRLKGVRGDKRIFVMVSHFPLGKEARLNIAPLMIEREKLYNPEGLPSFFMGDLNTREERPESEILRSWWTDSYLALPDTMKEGPKGTFNNHGKNVDMETAPRIDFVYYRGEGISPLRYVCNDGLYNGLYPSDHCPVYVDFLIK